MKATLLVPLALLSACGGGGPLPPGSPNWLLQGSGTSGKTTPVVVKPILGEASTLDLQGTIADPAGGLDMLAGWAVVAFDRVSMEARVGEVDAGGKYTLSHVPANAPQTLAVFTSDYILTSVLSMASTVPNTIRQFFTPKGEMLPGLRLRGPVVSFYDGSGINVMPDLASDLNGDGIPDGSVSVSSGGGLLMRALTGGRNDSTQDIDVDHVPNELDPDIDGDGIVNALDPDDNGNGQLDVFDPDANGDYVQDTNMGQEDTDGYFPSYMRHVSAQLVVEPGEGDKPTTSLRLQAELVQGDEQPLAVQVRGAPSLLNNSYSIGHDSAGNEFMIAFNRLLADDGLSDDGAAGDKLYGKRVFLDGGKTPRANEGLFFQLVYGTVEHPWFREFPIIFPNLHVGPITAQLDAATRTVQLVGNPFGDYQSFPWSVELRNAAGRVVWFSQAIPGTQRQYQVPENALESARGGSWRVSASAGKDGGPSYLVHSRAFSVP